MWKIAWTSSGAWAFPFNSKKKKPHSQIYQPNKKKTSHMKRVCLFICILAIQLVQTTHCWKLIPNIFICHFLLAFSTILNKEAINMPFELLQEPQ